MNVVAEGDEVLRDAPAWAPDPVALADLELLLCGAYAPLRGFMTGADLESLAATGRLADGTPWPVPVTLEVPDAVAGAISPGARVLVLTDREGAPMALLDVAEIRPGARAGHSGVGGGVRAYGDGHHGAFPRLRRAAAQIRAAMGGERTLGVITDRPLHRPQIAQISYAARTIGGRLLLMVPVAGPGPGGLPAEALVRAVFAAADRLPPAEIVAVPLVPHGRDSIEPGRDADEIRGALLRGRVAANYGATHILATGGMVTSGSGLHVLLPRELAYDTRDGQWRAADDITPRFQRAALIPAEIDELLDEGSALPEWHTPPAVARELARSRPPRRERGCVVFFTGLSGSGKSTVARGVADALRETGERTITLLDGDVVRRELSAGLTFTREDRDRNIRRIGWVAAEVARHGGMALCCPIAPYAAARELARAQASGAGGGFVLVHVATPLEVCERRDRKGLYAKARAGLITGMTGIDDPYEEPADADITLDTSQTSIDEAVAYVLDGLADGGWIDPR